ncbi:MAG: MFS transporter [Firmicutes bacterium]|nr:MFS transporter [Bacillota bacterium]
MLYSTSVRISQGVYIAMNQSWKTKFFAVASGQMVSLIGSSAVQFALIWWITMETGSAVYLGLAAVINFLPATFLSPYAGIIADRFHRKYICIISDLAIGGVALFFAVLLWLFDMPIWTALIILFMRSIGVTFHQPAVKAMIPQFVPEDALVKVNGWNQLMSSGSLLLGPALGAVLYAAFPMPVILLTDLICALVASALLATVRVERIEWKNTGKRNTFTELKEGILVFKEDRLLGMMILIETACMIFYSPIVSFYPLMTGSHFMGTEWHASAVEIATAIGMMASATLFGSVLKVKRLLFASYIGLLGLGVLPALCGLLPPTMTGWTIFAVLCAFIGVFFNVHGVPMVAYMQSTIAPHKMGRAFSLCAVIGSLTMPAGMVIAAPIAETIGVANWFLIAGVCITAISIVGIQLHRKLELQNTPDGRA